MKGKWKSAITAEFKKKSKKNLSLHAWVRRGGGGAERAADEHRKGRITQFLFASVFPDKIYLQASQETKHMNGVGRSETVSTAEE